jgi:hypothetical protein
MVIWGRENGEGIEIGSGFEYALKFSFYLGYYINILYIKKQNPLNRRSNL